MHLCEKNFTLAIYAVYFNNYLYSENNRVTGLLGRHVQQMIDSRKSFPFLCKLINDPKIGEKLPNGRLVKIY